MTLTGKIIHMKYKHEREYGEIQGGFCDAGVQA